MLRVLHPLDIAVVIVWLVLSLGLGVWLSRRASVSFESFFAADRSLPWWVVGTSMVATTFASDTPLAVSGWVASEGIARNWVWWTFGLTGMAAVFLFAPLWRRSEVLTDAELVELRYGPGPGTWLRRFKAVWFGVFFNALVIAWVVKAMVTLTTTLLHIPADDWRAVAIVAGLFVLTVVYTVASGLWGVVVTDLLQFVVAMGASITLAVLAWVHVGGLRGLKAGFAHHDLDWEATTALVPTDLAWDGPLAALVVLLALVWWSAHNIDGGGYLAQRLFAAKDERHATLAYLWFTVAHLVLRPWPWIVVGLVGLAMYGAIDQPETLYPRVMGALLPAGALGLMVASFLAAFMSTVDTQLNWGASLVVNDLWLPLTRDRAVPLGEVGASRVAIVVVAMLGAITSFVLPSIGEAWLLAFSVTAGLGSVYVARWLWWRTNAWSEVSAMIVATVLTFALEALRPVHAELSATDGWVLLQAIPAGWLSFPFSAGLIVLVGLPIWLTVTLLTPPPTPETLQAFSARVRPGGPGWPVHLRGPGGPGLRSAVGIASGAVAIYGTLLGTGWLLLGQVAWGLPSLGLALIGAVGCGLAVRGALARDPADATQEVP